MINLDYDVIKNFQRKSTYMLTTLVRQFGADKDYSDVVESEPNILRFEKQYNIILDEFRAIKNKILEKNFLSNIL